MTRSGLTTVPTRQIALSARPTFRSACLSPGRAGVYVEICAGSPPAGTEQNDWNLNLSRQVDTSEEEERIDVTGAVRMLRDLERERAAAATMHRYLAESVFDA